MKNIILYFGAAVYIVMTFVYTFLYFTGVKTVEVSNWVETKTINTFPMMITMWVVLIVAVLAVTIPLKVVRKLF